MKDIRTSEYVVSSLYRGHLRLRISQIRSNEEKHTFCFSPYQSLKRRITWPVRSGPFLRVAMVVKVALV